VTSVHQLIKGNADRGPNRVLRVDEEMAVAQGKGGGKFIFKMSFGWLDFPARIIYLS
jgi:hypothetical protein